jgi:hypothetical protein
MNQVREWGSQFTSKLGTRWMDPVTKGGFQVSRRGSKGEQRGARGAKKYAMYIAMPRSVHNGMLGVIERYQLYICITIIIGMNVVNNLNSV